MTIDQALEFLSSLGGDSCKNLSLSVQYQWNEDGPVENKVLGYPLTNELLGMLKELPGFVDALRTRVVDHYIADLEAEQAAAQKRLDDAKRDLGVT